MSSFSPLGLGSPRLRRQSLEKTEYVILQSALSRVLAFVGHSIDDVVNDPIVKNKVIGYYKLQKNVQRGIEVVELENQWNRRAG